MGWCWIHACTFACCSSFPKTSDSASFRPNVAYKTASARWEGVTLLRRVRDTVGVARKWTALGKLGWRRGRPRMPQSTWQEIARASKLVWRRTMYGNMLNWRGGGLSYTVGDGISEVVRIVNFSLFPSRFSGFPSSNLLLAEVGGSLRDIMEISIL
ncbi:hypothetical protein F4861DRAFT_294662 [Xylaria intraflava]|nr:hypothetical protein F4861DRAFT_294662 [Xylaria intraflava]